METSKMLEQANENITANSKCFVFNKLLKMRCQIHPSVLKQIKKKYCVVNNLENSEESLTDKNNKQNLEESPPKLEEKEETSPLISFNTSERQQIEDEAEQAKLAEKYKDFEFMPPEVKFLSEEIIKKITQDISKVKRKNYKNDVISGNVDLLINLENNTYKRFTVNFETMTVEEVYRTKEPFHIWDAMIKVNDRILMEICTHQRDFTSALKQGQIDIFGNTDCCKELKYIIKNILPTLTFRVPSDYSEFSDEEYSPDQKNLTKFYERWRDYTFKKRDNDFMLDE